MNLIALKRKHIEIARDQVARKNFAGAVALASFLSTAFFVSYLGAGTLLATAAVVVVPAFVYGSVKKSFTG